MISVRPISNTDYEAWCTLYLAYAEFYQVTQTKEMRDQVWSWLHEANHEVNGLIALDNEGNAVGLAHYRPFSRPLSASIGGFIDDLFVTPSARGNEIGKRLIEAVAQIGKEKSWSAIRWITAENNYRARNTYDKLATKTQWLTYDIKL
ncbi:GNAT family N-acetyltransferase [Methylotenera oryzisoli]|uniref:GNAT family N-acetyltransferase n=1 Tax=Methylotenera oryzisoli TaxID=2080758 RepID=A0A4Y9VQ81_9PROT|nr:GNAT family N-acetyltransferase [Methylotenera oryzisoli]TFW70280.1 GNAT family N-acetyltransferase [Methylotenera oryzisoli]